MTMNRQDLQKLRELPIEGVAERLGLQVTRHLCLCPFHDDHHASLSFSVRRNTFRCFVCGASGGTIDLVMRVLNLGFREACRWLNNESGNPAPLASRPFHRDSIAATQAFDASRYTPFFDHPYLSPVARHFLFDQRHLDPRVVRWCRLNSWKDRQGIDWLQIPYYDKEGKLTGIQYRNLSPRDLTTKLSTINSQLSTDSKPSTLNSKLSEAPRFRFRKGSECSIYNLPVFSRLRKGEELWITEGCSDCWAMLSSGRKAIAIPSATLLKPKDVEQLSTVNCQLQTEFHMYPDKDEPGERLFLQLKELLPNLVHHQLPVGCKDFSEFYLKETKSYENHG